MYGGGTFQTQNKVLPGAYVKFISAAKATTAMSERGVVAVGVSMNWGSDDAVFKVTADEFAVNSLSVLGYDYTADELAGFRDMFKNAVAVYVYRLNGGGIKAENSFGRARYSGTRGNDISVSVEASVDEEGMFDVTTRVGGITVDTQTGKSPADLEDNAFVVWNDDAAFVETAGMAMTGGGNGEETGVSHQRFLSLLENYTYNVLACLSDDDTVKGLYTAYIRRIRENTMYSAQVVLHDYAANYEGVINVKNALDLVWWTAGAEAGCSVNKTVLNMAYDGEFEIKGDYTAAELEEAVKSGEFVFHRVDDGYRVLEDINSLVDTTEEKGEDFKDNVGIRVMDQVGSDIAALFCRKYLGKVHNDKAGRNSLWSDIVSYCKELMRIRAIEDFEEGDVAVEEGGTKKSVVISMQLTPTGFFGQMYMTVVVA